MIVSIEEEVPGDMTRDKDRVNVALSIYFG